MSTVDVWSESVIGLVDVGDDRWEEGIPGQRGVIGQLEGSKRKHAKQENQPLANGCLPGLSLSETDDEESDHHQAQQAELETTDQENRAHEESQSEHVPSPSGPFVSSSHRKARVRLRTMSSARSP